MKICVVINNYNYARFVKDALESVLSQSRPADQIIIIDDGSTDESVELINRAVKDRDEVVFIAKENGGQLSAFNAAMPLVKSDIVTFLDSDDWYENDYLKSLQKVFSEPHVDYCLSSYNRVYQADERVEKILRSGDVGVRYLRSTLTHSWFGVPTSAIAMRLNNLKKILPYENEKFWKTRADEVLLHQCAVLGLNGVYCDKTLLNYRIHGKNLFFCKHSDVATEAEQSFSRKYMLKAEYDKIYDLPEKDLLKLFCVELESAKKNKSFIWKEFYYILIRLPLSAAGRMRAFLKMIV